MSSLLVRDGDCDGRVCMEENVLTVNYLHPADVGRYTCVAQNKYGRDQKHVNLDVKVTSSAYVRSRSHFPPSLLLCSRGNFEFSGAAGGNLFSPSLSLFLPSFPIFISPRYP